MFAGAGELRREACRSDLGQAWFESAGQGSGTYYRVVIESGDDYRRYMAADRAALGDPRGVAAWLTNDIWRFERSLRRFEYFQNTGSPLRVLAHLWWRRQGRRLGFTIPPNVFGPGLSIAHYGTIVVNSGARVGANCRLHVGVNIGTSAGATSAAPVLGDNCYIGPGAKLFGAITIGDNTAIGANAVVNHDFAEGGVTLGGVPAKVISDNSSDGLLIHGA